PSPAPALVPVEPQDVVVLDAAGRPVVVDARLAMSGEPATVRWQAPPEEDPPRSRAAGGRRGTGARGPGSPRAVVQWGRPGPRARARRAAGRRRARRRRATRRRRRAPRDERRARDRAVAGPAGGGPAPVARGGGPARDGGAGTGQHARRRRLGRAVAARRALV